MEKSYRKILKNNLTRIKLVNLTLDPDLNVIRNLSYTGDTEMLSALFDEHKGKLEPNNLIDSKGRNIVMRCIESMHAVNKKEIIQFYTNRGLNINHKSTTGLNLLMYAVINDKDVDLVKYIIGLGINLNDTDKQGSTALMYLTKRYAVKYDSYDDIDEMLKLLLLSGANPNIKNSKGMTVLMTALKNYRSITPVKLLLEKGADPMVSVGGFYPVHEVATNRMNKDMTGVLKLLMQYAPSHHQHDPNPKKSKKLSHLKAGPVKSIDIPNASTYTPAYVCISNGRHEHALPLLKMIFDEFNADKRFKCSNSYLNNSLTLIHVNQ